MAMYELCLRVCRKPGSHELNDDCKCSICERNCDKYHAVHCPGISFKTFGTHLIFINLIKPVKPYDAKCFLMVLNVSRYINIGILCR